MPDCSDDHYRIHMGSVTIDGKTYPKVGNDEVEVGYCHTCNCYLHGYVRSGRGAYVGELYVDKPEHTAIVCLANRVSRLEQRERLRS